MSCISLDTKMAGNENNILRKVEIKNYSRTRNWFINWTGKEFHFWQGQRFV
jgi:hypothetical protein